jgi:predicted nuclease of predicted toxin-antitoxin system
MRFLVDESCDVALAQALLEAGNDVVEIRVIRPGVDDEWVVNLSGSETRVLLTEDYDFGWLINAHGHKAIGVIFLRYPVSERHRIAKDLVELPLFCIALISHRQWHRFCLFSNIILSDKR